MESKGTHEFLLGIEEYLSNLGCKDHAADLHSLATALTKEDSKTEVTKLFLQRCVNLVKDKNVHQADLLHKFLKSKEQSEYLQSLLIFIMHQEYIDQSLKDLIFKTTKAQNQQDYFKCLLTYLTKNLDNLTLISSAHSLNKDSNDEFEIDFIRTSISNLELEFPGDKLFRGINSSIKNEHLKQDVINDAFSRSQIKSKFWLIKELEKIQKHYMNVLVLAGWFGQTKSIYEKFCTYQKMRILDLDRNACEVSDYVFNLSNLENHKVKSIVADINNLTLHKNGYEWTVENFKESEKNYNEKFLPDLIINTSAEHMTEEWFHQIRFKQLESNPIVAIQSNNMFDIDEHVNCVHSVDHMKKKFPMKEVLYEGELQLKGYKRVMLIGRP